MDVNYVYVLVITVVVIIVVLAVLLLADPVNVSPEGDTTGPKMEPIDLHDEYNLSGSKTEISEIDNFPFPIYIISLERKPERYEYVKQQLDELGIVNYRKFLAIDGKVTSVEEFVEFGVSEQMAKKSSATNKSESACAASHIDLWKEMVEQKAPWSLILEDDAHFHPDFLTLFPRYWEQVPQSAKIIFVGHCFSRGGENGVAPVVAKCAYCAHAYMINWETARELLEKTLPVNEAIDNILVNHFRQYSGAYLFNGNATVADIRPNDYKAVNGKRCIANGLIYQNQEQHVSTIQGVK